MALNSLICADVPLRNCSLTQKFLIACLMSCLLVGYVSVFNFFGEWRDRLATNGRGKLFGQLANLRSHLTVCAHNLALSN